MGGQLPYHKFESGCRKCFECLDNPENSVASTNDLTPQKSNASADTEMTTNSLPLTKFRRSQGGIFYKLVFISVFDFYHFKK